MMRLMTNLIRKSVIIGALGAVTVSPAAAEDQAKQDMSQGEAELAELLDGRVAGEPVRCLRQSQHRGIQIIDDTAMVFRSGSTIYVNRTNAPRFLDEFDLPVFEMFGSSLCTRDQVEMRNRLANASFAGPIILLGEFVPYTKKEKAEVGG